MLNGFDNHLGKKEESPAKRNKTSQSGYQVLEHQHALLDNPSSLPPVLLQLIKTPNDFVAFMYSSTQCQEAALRFIETNPTKYLDELGPKIALQICKQSLSCALAYLQNFSLMQNASLKGILDIVFSHDELRHFYLSCQPFVDGLEIHKLSANAQYQYVAYALKNDPTILYKIDKSIIFRNISQNLELFQKYVNLYGENDFFEKNMSTQAHFAVDNGSIIQGMTCAEASDDVGKFILSLNSFKEKVEPNQLAYIVKYKPSLKDYIEQDTLLNHKFSACNPALHLDLNRFYQGPSSRTMLFDKRFNHEQSSAPITRDQLLGGIEKYLKEHVVIDPLYGHSSFDPNSRFNMSDRFEKVRINEACKDKTFAKALIDHGALEDSKPLPVNMKLAQAIVCSYPELADSVLDWPAAQQAFRLTPNTPRPAFMTGESDSRLIAMGHSSIKVAAKLLSFENIDLPKHNKEDLQKSINFANNIHLYSNKLLSETQANQSSKGKRKIDNV